MSDHNHKEIKVIASLLSKSRMAAKRKNVTEAEVDTEERQKLICDVTAEITERLVAEEEEQPVPEVESRSCCYLYRR